MMVPPGRSAPEASAASTMRSAIRSFTDPPGLKYSTLASTAGALRALAQRLGHRAQPEQRGVADQFDQRFMDLHQPPLPGRAGNRRYPAAPLRARLVIMTGSPTDAIPLRAPPAFRVPRGGACRISVLGHQDGLA